MLPGMFDDIITVQEYNENLADIGDAPVPGFEDLLKDIDTNVYYRPGGTTRNELGPESYDRVDFTVWWNAKLLKNPPSFYQILHNNQTYRVNAIEKVGGNKYMLKLITAVFYTNYDENKL